MAGISGFYIDHDVPNRRMLVGWTEDGIVHRLNILMADGSRIELHAHSYDHTFRIKSGRYRLTDIAPDGTEKISSVTEGAELLMPKWHQHAFERTDEGTGPGVIDCFWPEGADQ